MFTDSKMRLNLTELSLVHPDDTDHPNTPLSNIPFDELIELRNSDYISSEVLEFSDETDDCNLFQDSRLEKENNHAYDRAFQNKKLEDSTELHINLPAVPPTQENKGHKFTNKIGDGKMDYIKDKLNKEMFTNAWKAITFTNNWDFIAQEIESFSFSKDPRIYDITEKMEELGYKGHSGTSFGFTMRSMQYLVRYGEEEFKNMF